MYYKPCSEKKKHSGRCLLKPGFLVEINGGYTELRVSHSSLQQGSQALYYANMNPEAPSRPQNTIPFREYILEPYAPLETSSVQH